MSTGKHRLEYGGDDRNTLVAVNPREEVLGSNSDPVVDTAINYEGTVYRADNIDRIDDIAEFYRHEELLAREPDPETEIDIEDASWYDRAFLFDEDGLDTSDANYITNDARVIDIIGGPLEDIGTVVNSLGTNQNYTFHTSLIFDYGGIDARDGYMDDDLVNLDHVLENNPELMDERLTRSGLEDVTFEI